MSQLEAFCLLVLIVLFIVAFKGHKPYLVVAKHPDSGFEVRRTTHSVYVHVTDEKLWRAHVNRMREMVLRDLEGKQ